MFSPIRLAHLALSIVISLYTAALSSASQGDERPNIVIIYGDDVGFADVSVNVEDGGNTSLPRILTPNLDKVAGEGLNFTDAHSSAATCTPSRYSLLTGVHAFRKGVAIAPPNAPSLITTDMLTLPAMLKRAGYRTGIVGKWHLGIGEKGVGPDWNGALKPGPLELGFDSAYILPTTNDRVPCVYVDGHYVENYDPEDPIYVGDTLEEVQMPGSTQYPNARELNPKEKFYKSVVNGIGRIGYMSGGKAALWDDYTSTDVFVGKAIDFIEESKDKPFFLFYSAQDIHIPNAPNERFQGQTNLGARGDAMVQLDWAVGEIVNSLEQYGLRENTILVFTSDNGPTHHADAYSQTEIISLYSPHAGDGHDASGKWRGGKYEIYEGATRVPLMISWPKRVDPATTDALVNQIDFIASFSRLLRIDLAEDEAQDSRDTLDAFLGKDLKGLEYTIEEGRGIALRFGDWKYIPAKKIRGQTGFWPEEESLFDLSKDPGEQVNVIAQYPELAGELASHLEKIRKSKGVRELDRRRGTVTALTSE
ncbi:sulfatase-like hydrolase/transferase [Pelagicoccus mobilis]|uniref:Sulfatase-like hydrolase/transferase n=1 Tax=Pelagicoccus mobilis TaxID=415221 RepID=A0A934VTG8_9BACT|nr:sulfatase-like hydrolase/transferase [Pelagicoccus mobilis]MBK1880055.1 sulfatase-like hydrolase/transferase [Pelagicoccus mobilis]